MIIFPQINRKMLSVCENIPKTYLTGMMTTPVLSDEWNQTMARFIGKHPDLLRVPCVVDA